ncbi:hypothetical protein D3C81_2194810 [compost metagenome]
MAGLPRCRIAVAQPAVMVEIGEAVRHQAGFVGQIVKFLCLEDDIDIAGLGIDDVVGH